MILLAILALCFATPAGARQSHPPIPKGNPGEWVLTDDYPASALRGNIQGVVHFVLTVDAAGHPTNCKVTESSGFLDLDDAACAKVLQRGEFIPATDTKGRPAVSTWSSSVRWQIPDDQEAPKPGLFVASFVVDPDGSLSDCRVEKAEGSFAVVPKDVCPEGATMKPVVDANGKPVRKRIRVTMHVEQEDVTE